MLYIAIKSLKLLLVNLTWSLKTLQWREIESESTWLKSLVLAQCLCEPQCRLAAPEKQDELFRLVFSILHSTLAASLKSTRASENFFWDSRAWPTLLYSFAFREFTLRPERKIDSSSLQSAFLMNVNLTMCIVSNTRHLEIVFKEWITTRRTEAVRRISLTRTMLHWLYNL